MVKCAQSLFQSYIPRDVSHLEIWDITAMSSSYSAVMCSVSGCCLWNTENWNSSEELVEYRKMFPYPVHCLARQWIHVRASVLRGFWMNFALLYKKV